MPRKMGRATRDAYGHALAAIGETNKNIVVLDADLSKSTRTSIFGERFPERFIDIGIQEANLVGIASGLASCGKVPFISSFACFMMCKGYDQLRMAVAFPELNVKVVTSHGGISVGEDGASQQSIEDVALALTLPNFDVIVPADEVATQKLIELIAGSKRPAYVRTGRPKTPVVYDDRTRFEIGKGISLREGKDLTLVATGLLVAEALEAAELLEKEGIEAGVIDIHTLKPLDEKLLLEAAKKTGALVVAEEHSIKGGLGALVSQLVSKNHPVPVEFVAIQDTYAESGNPKELFKKYGLTAGNIVQAARSALSRKTKS